MICESVQRLIDYALSNEFIRQEDIIVVRNRLIDALQLTDWRDCQIEGPEGTIDEILAPLVDYA